jgi:hypothetical protein
VTSPPRPLGRANPLQVEADALKPQVPPAQVEIVIPVKEEERDLDLHHSAQDSVALDDEINAGVVAVRAAAFSVESVVFVLAEQVMPTRAVVAWPTSSPPSSPADLKRR